MRVSFQAFMVRHGYMIRHPSPRPPGGRGGEREMGEEREREGEKEREGETGFLLSLFSPRV